MNRIWKRLKTRTYRLAIFIAISSNLPLVSDLLGKYYGITALVIAVLVAYHRELTTKPVSER